MLNGYIERYYGYLESRGERVAVLANQWTAGEMMVEGVRQGVWSLLRHVSFCFDAALFV
jgi:hypothetical protein